jgi:hypothetical protein
MSSSILFDGSFLGNHFCDKLAIKRKCIFGYMTSPLVDCYHKHTNKIQVHLP